MDAREPETLKLVDEVETAFAADDADRVRGTLERHPQLKALINQPVGPFDSPAIVNACSREMLDVLLEAGADINARSRWWAGGFGLLDSAPPELAAHAIERGARVDVHAAARLGMMERLRELITKDPAVVHARGGDGQTALHFASTMRFSPPLEAVDADFSGTPLRWAIHGSEHGWYSRTGDYDATVEVLIRAGAKRLGVIEGSPVVQDVLRRYASISS